MAMKHFFALTFRPFFVLTGAGTTMIGFFAFWPDWAVENLVKLAFLREYTIIVQHWGIMVGLTGLFMIGAAFQASWRTPILLYSALEKSFIVYLVLANARHSFADGFWVACLGDAAIVLYTVAYFAVCGL
jgi:hypothetical protein